MTICATEGAAAPTRPHRATLTIAADGSYAARLARHDDAAGSWFPERWTLGGPEPYAVPLQGTQPEEPDSALLPLADGRVLIARRVADRFAVSLLYPAGPGTGELLLGAVEAPELTLLPPAPDGTRGYALAPAADRTTLWLLHGGAGGPERVAEIPGRCSGGAWLDRAGRLLALDREWAGRTKAVTVDLARGGETGPLLQITEDSNDRLLMADPDSGLLLVRSDAPGQDRIGWGVLGSHLPVRFPECLYPAGATVTPFAMQPRQMLAPESCAVAFRVDGAHGTWLGVWRPSVRQLRQFPAPRGWLTGAGLWTAGGELLLPHTTAAEPCGVARLRMALPPVTPEPAARRERTAEPERRPVGPLRAVVPERAVRAAAPERPARTVEPPQAAWTVEPARAAVPVAAAPARRPWQLVGPLLPVRQPPAGVRTWTRVGVPAGAPAAVRVALPAEVPPRADAEAGTEAGAAAEGEAGAGPVGGPDAAPNAAPDAAPYAAPEVVHGGGIVPDGAEIDNRSTSSAQPPGAEPEPRRSAEHPPLCRPVPLQQAPLAAR
ncbi:hypothetical protein ACFXN2_20995 [Streptomyces kronopolitis]|uniref:hypothetical protein n=1 Tax=Streptomyces kronopolitis TaxID=1612435 RepID=UPI003699900F